MLQAYLVAKPFNLPPAALKQEPDFRRTILTEAIPQLLASQEDPTTEIVDVVELATTKNKLSLQRVPLQQVSIGFVHFLSFNIFQP